MNNHDFRAPIFGMGREVAINRGISILPSITWTLLGTREGYSFPDDIVHFGYRDNIMQPRFEGTTTRSAMPTDNPWLRSVPCCWDIRPTWKVCRGGFLNPKILGHNGTFNAFRVLKQDVAGFEKYLDQAASYLLTHPQVDEVLPPGAEVNICQVLSIAPPSRHGALREIVAANCAADGAMARHWPSRRKRLIRNVIRRNSTTLRATPAALMGPISAGAIRAAGRSYNG